MSCDMAFVYFLGDDSLKFRPEVEVLKIEFKKI